MESPNNQNINTKGFERETDSEIKDSLIRPIRTYKDDVANLVKGQKISTASIVLAEQKRRQSQQYKQEELEEKPKGKFIKVFASIVFFGLGIAALVFAIKMNLIPQSIKNIVSNFNQQEPEIIQKENSIKILTSIKTNSELRNEISNKIKELSEEGLDQVIEFKIQKPTQTPEGEFGLEKITSTNFLNIINTNTSDRFERSLLDDFLFAIYTDSKPTPFIIFKTNDINLSFSEIFEWESRMYNDLSLVLDLKPEVPDFIRTEVPIVATSTEENTENGTSTPQTEIKVSKNTKPRFDPLVFSDIVISNKDSRAILDEEGEVILIYSFIDEENLLITSDLNVFQQVIKRLSAQKLLR